MHSSKSASNNRADRPPAAKVAGHLESVLWSPDQTGLSLATTEE
eukprot:COSAG04_NODE_15604_length_526_cov_2.060890_1_plen_43_part_10